jgi:iduronate 2-sulfatase
MMANDLNNSLGCYGHPLVKSPNLDRLAARGVRFQNASCQFPICGPSRNSMLTGLYPNSTGILTNSLDTNGHDDPGSWELELNPAGCDRLLEHPDIFSPGNFGGILSWYASPRPDEQHTDGLQAKNAEWVLERCANEPSSFMRTAKVG